MTTNNVYVNIPKSDMPFFRKLSRKMGWSYTDKEAQKEKQKILDSIERGYKEVMAAEREGRELPHLEDLIAELKAI